MYARECHTDLTDPTEEIFPTKCEEEKMLVGEICVSLRKKV